MGVQLSKSKRPKNGVLLILFIFITFLHLPFFLFFLLLFFKCNNWCCTGSAAPGTPDRLENCQAKVVEGVLLPRAYLPDRAVLAQEQDHWGLPDRLHPYLLPGQALLQLQGAQQVRLL